MIFPRAIQAQLPEHIIGRPCDACTPTLVYPADLDEDGDEDVLFISRGDDKIAWYENQTAELEADPDGFGPAQTIASGANSAFAFTADLDGDADLDVIAEFDDTILWFENEGGGSFGARKVVARDTPGLNKIDAADFDGDGDVDLVAAFKTPESAIEGRIAWYENQIGESDGGDGFSTENVITTNIELPVADIAIADFDGDNDLDVVAGSREEITWYKNQIGEQDAEGDSFSSKYVIIPRTAPDFFDAISIIANDFDGDGDPDVATFNRRSPASDSEVAWHENLIGEPGEDLDGFSSAYVLANADYTSYTSIESVDADEDGDPDILVSSSDFVLYSNEIGEPDADSDGFDSALVITSEKIGAFALAHIDDNDHPDLLFATPGKDRIAWYKNEGSCTFTSVRVMSTAASNEYPFYATASDFTGNGNLDVLVASSEDRKVALYENEGDGTFASEQVVATDLNYSSWGVPPWSVTLGDFDGDGAPDLLTVEDADDESLAWFENQLDASDSFGPRRNVFQGDHHTNIEDVFSVDLNSDGAQDAVALIDEEITWFKNQGGGTFGSQQSIMGYSGDYLSFTDLDGDGDFDLLTEKAWYPNQISEQSAEGDAFGTRQVIDYSGTIRMAADLDGDGDPDAIGINSHQLVWYVNQHGEQTADNDRFSDARVISSGVQISTTIKRDDIAVVDLDNDGDSDIVTIQTHRIQPHRAYWHENRLDDSDHGFDPAVPLTPVNTSTTSFSTGKIDSDDKPDLLLTARLADKIAWYETSISSLPVELLSLTATADKQSVHLSWKTVSETSNAGFHVERRPGMLDAPQSTWQRLNFIQGAGTANEPHSYNYEDVNLPTGASTLVYRLRQVDFDGTYEYSSMVEVQVSSPEQVALNGPFPNPARESVTIPYALPQAMKVQLDVFDVLGRRVATLERGPQDAGFTQITFDVSGFTSGTYMLRLQAGGHSDTRRITIVR